MMVFKELNNWWTYKTYLNVESVGIYNCHLKNHPSNNKCVSYLEIYTIPYVIKLLRIKWSKFLCCLIYKYGTKTSL